MQHTPGEWTAKFTFDDEPAYVVVNATSDGTAIAQLPADEHIPWPERLANARLIAASPKLYRFVLSRAAGGDRVAMKLLAQHRLPADGVT